MSLPNALSLGRILLAPVFYLVFHLPQWLGAGHVAALVALIVIFLWSEISDIIDGHVARARGQVSAIGKILDPFSDVVTHTTYFFCFVEAGFLPGWLFLLFLFRELGIILIRMVLLTEGFALAAGTGGKIKSLLYAIASGLGILVAAGQTFGLQAAYAQPLLIGFYVAIGLGVLMSLISFGFYAVRFWRLRQERR